MTNPNDSANGYGFSTADGRSHSEEKGNTKYEEALLRFMCAIVSGIFSDANAYRATLEGAASIGFKGTAADYVALNANQLTEAYFNELNKQSQ